MNVLGFLRDLFALLRHDRRLMGWLILVTIFVEFILLPQPLILAWMLGAIQERAPWWYVGIGLAAIVFLQLSWGLIGILRTRLSRRLCLGVANRLRSMFFHHLLRLPYPYFLEHQAGGQANAYLNDIDDVDRSATQLFETALRSITLMVLYSILLIIWNPVIMACAAVLLPVTVAAQRFLRRKVKQQSRDKVDRREEFTATVSEAVQNVSVVKSATLESWLIRRLRHIGERFQYADVHLETNQSALRSSATAVAIFGQYAFFAIGAIQVIAGHIGIPAFLAQLFIITNLSNLLSALLQYLNQLTQSHAALHRIRSVLDRDREGSEAQRTVTELPLHHGGAEVAIEHVRFRYREDVPLFEDISMHAQSGETVAIVGPSGSGKTTLLNLMIGLFGDYGGSMRINDVEVAHVDLQALRSQIGVVFQEHVLFSASVRANLLIGVDASDSVDDAALWQALEQAHAADFVRALPDGLDTRIGMSGMQLSGGQRQRLAIARVILKNPPLLLLDEATSALDSISERHIQKALDTLFEGRTSVVVAHRLSTIVNADRIYVIDGGRVLESGTHQELLADPNGHYRKLFDAQVEGFVA